MGEGGSLLVNPGSLVKEWVSWVAPPLRRGGATRQAIRLMPQGVEQWIWISDFHGFGFADCDPRIAHIFLDISARHYPERLGRFLVVCPSSHPIALPPGGIQYTDFRDALSSLD